jgi:hypothetical protein
MAGRLVGMGTSTILMITGMDTVIVTAMGMGIIIIITTMITITTTTMGMSMARGIGWWRCIRRFWKGTIVRLSATGGIFGRWIFWL